MDPDTNASEEDFSWRPANELEAIAYAVGRHFFHVSPNKPSIAVLCGMDCAREVLISLDEFRSLD